MQKEIRLVRDELARAAQRLRAEQDDETALKQKIETEHAKAGEEERALAGVRAEEAAKAARSETSRKELGQMTAALARLEKNLADLKEARKREENTYSVVPYNGKRGENRRPVYVECAAGRVIFHPDPTPLDEPFSPSAVRAEVDRRLALQKERLPPAQASAFAPYLMLLIRPAGVSTYYRFRQALQGSRIDFGYEFVDKDWVLDFPAEDRDSPPPTWLTAAKPSGAAPSSPDATAPRMHGVPSAPDREATSVAPNPGGNAGGSPGGPSPLAGSKMAYSAGKGGLPFPAGSAPDGPRGATGFGPAAGSGGPSLFAQQDPGRGGAVAGPPGGPRPYPGGASANAGAPGSGPAGAGAQGTRARPRPAPADRPVPRPLGLPPATPADRRRLRRWSRLRQRDPTRPARARAAPARPAQARQGTRARPRPAPADRPAPRLVGLPPRTPAEQRRPRRWSRLRRPGPGGPPPTGPARRQASRRPHPAGQAPQKAPPPVPGPPRAVRPRPLRPIPAPSRTNRPVRRRQARIKGLPRRKLRPAP